MSSDQINRSKSKPLRVQPVKRYPKPKYPSHVDPDPTLHPAPVAYPIGKKALSVIAASATLLIPTGCQPTSPAVVASDDGSKNFQELLRDHEDELGVDHEQERQQYLESLHFDSLQPNDPFVHPRDERVEELRTSLIEKAGGNPLCVAVSGLPQQTSPYGTGVPDRVDGDIARRYIERIFKGAGFAIKPDVQFDKQGIACQLDGYDEQRHVGFVVGDWHSLDNDAIVSWSQRVEDGSFQDAASEIAMLTQIAAMNIYGKKDAQSTQMGADIEAAKRLPDPAKAIEALKRILKRQSAKMLSLEEFKNLEQLATEGKEFIAVFSVFDGRFLVPWNFEVASQSTDETDLDSANDSGEHLNQFDPNDPFGSSQEKSEAYYKRIAEMKAKAVMKALEKSAREYIEWAQSQGLK